MGDGGVGTSDVEAAVEAKAEAGERGIFLVKLNAEAVKKENKQK